MKHESAETLAQQLDTIGVIALIPGEMPHNRVLEIADALLASPILAVQVIPNGPNSLDTLNAIRKRADGHMLVGAGRVESPAELDEAISAGAQFASSAADFNIQLLSHARRQGFFYIPTVHAPGQMLVAHRAGCHWQIIRDDIDVEGLEGLIERAATINYGVDFIINQVATENIDACYDAGAKLVFCNDIYTNHDQPMRDFITRAREARQISLAASHDES